MGPDPAGLAAGIAAADLRQARQEPRWVGDDLDRTDLAPRGTRDQLDPDTIDGVLRAPLPWGHGVDPDPANNAHLLPSTGQRHAGVDPAPAEWVDGRHVRLPAPPAAVSWRPLRP